MAAITPKDRARLAGMAGVSDQYLYQCLTGRREMGAQEAVRVEQQTAGELRRWQLCQATWHRIWPELVGTDGAPNVPAPAEAV
jgi:DNA-binding transcriptional regulator YdaS (Cro superfamily)